jgi:uncharacterized protein YwbE
MRLHTRLTATEVYSALGQAQLAGKVTSDIRFMVFRQYRSRTHPHGYEVQLGTWDKDSLPSGTVDQHGKNMRVRRFKNSGSHGAHSDNGTGESVWAATWHEWGWFIASVFAADPGARFGGLTGWNYLSPGDFHRKTGGQFRDFTVQPGYRTWLSREEMTQAAWQADLDVAERTRLARATREAEERAARKLLAQERAARQAEIDNLIDDPVFGRQVAPGTKFRG